MGDYDDIIHLPHQQSEKHPHMSLEDRAAQFAPFAALSGHAALISKTEADVEAFFATAPDDEWQQWALD